MANSREMKTDFDIDDLKQDKARAKSAFTRARHHLLNLLDDDEIPPRRAIREAQRKLNLAQETVVETLCCLSKAYRMQSDGASRQKVIQEIDIIEIEFNEAHRKTEEYLDNNKNEMSSVTIEISQTVKVKQAEHIKARENVERVREQYLSKEKEVEETRKELQLRQKQLDKEINDIKDQLSFAEADAQTKHLELENAVERELGISDTSITHLKAPRAKPYISTPLQGADLTRLGESSHISQYVPWNVTEEPVTLHEVKDQGPIVNQSDMSPATINIGQDLWKQLQRVSIPVFTGDVKTYESWRAAFIACIDKAPATAEYKLLQLRQYLSGEALKAIESLGHSATAYEAAKERLERKFGGQRRKLAIYMEQLENFKPIRPGNANDIEKFADLLDITTINLKEAGKRDELGQGSLYCRLQKKMPESMLARYHRWVFETGVAECVESLRDWINKEAEFQTIAHETVKGIVVNDNINSDTRKPRQTKTRTLFGSETASDVKKLCKLCGNKHGIWACSEFKDMTIPQRWDYAKLNYLCYRCLGDNHKGQECTRTRICGVNGCKNNHNRLLHKETKPLLSVKQINTDNSKRANYSREQYMQTLTSPTMEGEQANQAPQTSMLSNKTGGEGFIALRTLPVILKNGNRKVKVNALLDDGSTQTYVNTDIAAELGLQGTFEKVTVSVLNGKIDTFQTMPVKLGLESLDEKVNTEISALTTDRVTGDMCVTDWSTYSKKWNHLRGIHFAKFSARPVVDILIGLDYADLHFSHKDVRGDSGQPIARLTPLGWTCIGCPVRSDQNIAQTNFARTYHFQHVKEIEDLNTTLKRFWKIDNGGLNSEVCPVTNQDKEILNKTENSIRQINGKFQVSIPWKDDRPKITSNYEMAVRRLESTEKKLMKDPDIAKLYSGTIQQYKEKDYLKKIHTSDEKPPNVWYLPHFPVVKPDRSTTKVRIVFDASAQDGGVCLNDLIHQGPKLQRNLFDVLMRFRKNSIAIVCDIAEMYLRIEIDPKDRPYHRFLWRDLDQSKQPEEYEFSRVVFGVNSSPFLAQLVTQHHARKCAKEFPMAADTVLKSNYMDDSMDSVENNENAKELYRQLSELWSKAGMHARKWLSNSPELLANIPSKDRASQLDLVSSPLPTIKTLGIFWIAQEDVFTFSSKCPTDDFKVTKRNFLKKVAIIFDPLGFVSPYVIRAKILLQELWVAGLDWDDEVEDAIQSRIITWLEELNSLKNVTVPRCLRMGNDKHVKKLTFQVFVDASQEAYAAVVYARCQYEDDEISLRFVASKARVTPLTSVSIPRLELIAAVTGLRLATSIRNAIEVPSTHITFWSDSQNVLYWIRRRSRQFKTFVANRVGEIHMNSEPNQWRHVPTKLNPADLATRGTSIEELKTSTLWWQGPEFLLKPETYWPANKVEECGATTELRKVDSRSKTSKQQLNINLLNRLSAEDSWRLEPKRFSSWLRLIRTQAWVHRFLDNCRQPKEFRALGELTTEEIKDAEIQIIKHAQHDAFPEEFKNLIAKKELPKDSKLITLNPKIDIEGVMRSDGRLKQAEFLPYDLRFPVILPRKSWVTKLIVKDYHEKAFHVGGTNRILADISEHYWIPSGREEIKEWERECTMCKKRKSKGGKQIMSPLPEIRLKPSLCAFSKVAVDYGGPFITVQGRGKKRAKRYLCLFTCLATRGVHLEMAYALDTDSFLNAFYRMVNRRGLPEEIMSDNGGNFVKAEKDLRELVTLLDKDKIQRSAANRGIKWHFNPPLAPHFGGVHETMIKAAKRAIYAILGNADVTDEELVTAFTGAEALINSRPLTYQSAHPGDETPLTPNHSIHGRIGGEFAPESVDTTKFNPILRWRRVQEIVKHFWRRWMREWLPGLSPRKKWQLSYRDFQVGDVVLVLSTDIPRGHWPMGRIIEVFPGKDGHVRVAKVQTAKTVLIRPISKLCPLETVQ